MAISRRKALQALGAVPVAAGFSWTPAEAAQAHQHATQARKAAGTGKAAYAPKFFTKHEWQTVRVLADLVIPKDARSGSATEAGVPEFIDFMMTDPPLPDVKTGRVPNRQTAMRGGLRWLDTECRRRFDKTFVACTPAERTAVLDDIAWPAKARPELSQGAAFFSSFRDLTASGFWSSKMGIEDLQYIGNMPHAWDGCPSEALGKIGVSYPQAD